MLNYGQALDPFFTALADPTRRRMVAQLSRGPASVSQLAEPLDISLPAVLQHLRVLEHSGLVTTMKVGRVRTCRIEQKAFLSAESWMESLRQMWEERLDRLGAFLEQETRKGKA